VGEDDISQKLIRFHVIANSDSAEDQNLKLNVRDKVLKEIGPKLEKSGSKEESEKIIESNLGSIKHIAETVVKDSGKKYGVSVSLGKSMFPVKSYNDITLPAGEYDALKITLGSGEGKNWWCVMFPPLCFVDITNGITSQDTENRMKYALNDDEYRSILNVQGQQNSDAVKKPIEGQEKGSSSDIGKSGQKVEIKFKSVEIIKSIIKKLENIINKK
jgi:stage II sporulation protein R